MWKPDCKSTDDRYRATFEIWDRLRRGLLRGPISRSETKSQLCPSHRAQSPVELFCLHLLLFCERGLRRSNNSQHRPFQEISGTRTREFCAEQPFHYRSSLHQRRCDGGITAVSE